MSVFSIVVGIVGIVGFIFAIYRFIDEKKFGMKVFEERTRAQRGMIGDMIRSEELNYVGITHEKMVSYLKEAFAEGKELHWQTINFYFPTPEYGRCWDEDFDNKMSLSILEICNFLMNEKAGMLKKLRRINFYLNSCGFNIGGSLFKYTSGKQSVKKDDIKKNNKHSYTVIYDVMQVKGRNREQDNARTIRLNHRFNKQFFKRFAGTFEEIKKGAELLYRIDLNQKNRDLWNQSASDWNKYEQDNTSPHLQSMNFMLNQVDIPECRNILSLGAGTGKMEMQLITNKGYNGFLGLADKSYTMLYQAYGRMKNETNVSYALIDLSRKDWPLYGTLAGRKYDYILIHFSLHNFISAEQNLDELARRLKQILAYNGKIVIAIHDHVYEQYDENELLRNRIKEFAVSNRIGKPGISKTISLYDLKSEFFNNKLSVIRETELVVKRRISERITMWHVDAILDSVLDVSKLYEYGLKDALFKELNTMKEEYTAPMIVKYITFSEIIEVVSALIVNDSGEFLTVIKRGSDAYLLPGGEMILSEKVNDKLPQEEREKETLLRELDEELGIRPENIDIGDKIDCFTFEKAYLEHIPLYMHVYRCTLKQVKLTPALEVSGYDWIDLKKFTTYDNMPKEYFLKILKAAGIMLRETAETK